VNIISHVCLTPAQIKAIDGFQFAVVRTELSKPCVVVTFTTFQAQEVKVTLNKAGVIENVTWGDKSTATADKNST